MSSSTQWSVKVKFSSTPMPLVGTAQVDGITNIGTETAAFVGSGHSVLATAPTSSSKGGWSSVVCQGNTLHVLWEGELKQVLNYDRPIISSVIVVIGSAGKKAGVLAVTGCGTLWWSVVSAKKKHGSFWDQYDRQSPSVCPTIQPSLVESCVVVRNTTSSSHTTGHSQSTTLASSKLDIGGALAVGAPSGGDSAASRSSQKRPSTSPLDANDTTGVGVSSLKRRCTSIAEVKNKKQQNDTVCVHNFGEWASVRSACIEQIHDSAWVIVVGCPIRSCILQFDASAKHIRSHWSCQPLSITISPELQLPASRYGVSMIRSLTKLTQDSESTRTMLSHLLGRCDESKLHSTDAVLAIGLEDGTVLALVLGPSHPQTCHTMTHVCQLSSSVVYVNVHCLDTVTMLVMADSSGHLVTCLTPTQSNDDQKLSMQVKVSKRCIRSGGGFRQCMSPAPATLLALTNSGSLISIRLLYLDGPGSITLDSRNECDTVHARGGSLPQLIALKPQSLTRAIALSHGGYILGCTLYCSSTGDRDSQSPVLSRSNGSTSASSTGADHITARLRALEQIARSLDKQQAVSRTLCNDISQVNQVMYLASSLSLDKNRGSHRLFRIRASAQFVASATGGRRSQPSSGPQQLPSGTMRIVVRMKNVSNSAISLVAPWATAVVEVYSPTHRYLAKTIARSQRQTTVSATLPTSKSDTQQHASSTHDDSNVVHVAGASNYQATFAVPDTCAPGESIHFVYELDSGSIYCPFLLRIGLCYAFDTVRVVIPLEDGLYFDMVDILRACEDDSKGIAVQQQSQLVSNVANFNPYRAHDMHAQFSAQLASSLLHMSRAAKNNISTQVSVPVPITWYINFLEGEPDHTSAAYRQLVANLIDQVFSSDSAQSAPSAIRTVPHTTDIHSTIGDSTYLLDVHVSCSAFESANFLTTLSMSTSLCSIASACRAAMLERIGDLAVQHQLDEKMQSRTERIISLRRFMNADASNTGASSSTANSHMSAFCASADEMETELKELAQRMSQIRILCCKTLLPDSHTSVLPHFCEHAHTVSATAAELWRVYRQVRRRFALVL
jgi:hypothetical protein